jgi:hypothetical protein
MIYQHRLVVAREGRLEKRHSAFQDVAMARLDGHGSVLLGAWEVWIGGEAGSGVYQLRQFESLAQWEIHQNKVRADKALTGEAGADLHPHLDFVDTSIVRMADDLPSLPQTWPAIDEVRGTPRGFIEQRIIHMRPAQKRTHHALYREEVEPALRAAGVELIGLFDTVIGSGTTNGASHCSVELRRFEDLAGWQAWRELQETDPALRELVKTRWMSTVVQVNSELLRPLDYSRIR